MKLRREMTVNWWMRLHLMVLGGYPADPPTTFEKRELFSGSGSIVPEQRPGGVLRQLHLFAIQPCEELRSSYDPGPVTVNKKEKN